MRLSEGQIFWSETHRYLRYFFLHILPYSIIFYMKQFSMENMSLHPLTSFITVKLCHPKRAIAQYATHLAPPCLMKFPVWVKLMETPVWYARKVVQCKYGYGNVFNINACWMNWYIFQDVWGNNCITDV
jgi:hypothetical protein